MRLFSCPRQWQHMIPRQRRKRQVWKRAWIDPENLVDFRLRPDGSFDVHFIDRGLYAPSRLIRGGTFENAKRARGPSIDTTTEFFKDLAAKRREVAFPIVAFAAGLHESRGPLLTDNKHATLLVADERRDDADDPVTHRGLRRTVRIAPDRAAVRAGGGV